MVRSKQHKPIVKPEEVKTKPAEVKNIENLLQSSGWWIIEKRIEWLVWVYKDKILKPIPLWLTREQRELHCEDMERLKNKMAAYEELLELPYEILESHGETEFIVNRQSEV